MTLPSDDTIRVRDLLKMVRSQLNGENGVEPTTVILVAMAQAYATLDLAHAIREASRKGAL